MIPIIGEEFYAWVAPSGNIQITLLAEDEITCHAIAKMWYKAGLGKSPHEMKRLGFTVEKVRLTIVKEPVSDREKVKRAMMMWGQSEEKAEKYAEYMEDWFKKQNEEKKGKDGI